MFYNITKDNELIVSKLNIKGTLTIKDIENKYIKYINLNEKVNKFKIDTTKVFIEKMDCKNLKELHIFVSNIIKAGKITEFINTEDVTDIYLYNNVGMTIDSGNKQFTILSEFKNIKAIHHSWWVSNYKFNNEIKFDLPNDYKYIGITIEHLPYVIFQNDYEEIIINTDNKKTYILNNITEEMIENDKLIIPSKYSEAYINKLPSNINKIILQDKISTVDLTKLNNYVIDQIEIVKNSISYNTKEIFLNNNVKIKTIKFQELLVPINYDINEIIVRSKNEIILKNEYLNFSINDNVTCLTLSKSQEEYENENNIINVNSFNQKYNTIEVDLCNIKDNIVNIDLKNAIWDALAIPNAYNDNKKINITLSSTINNNESQEIITNCTINNIIIEDNDINCIDNEQSRVVITLNDKVKKIYITKNYYIIVMKYKTLIVDKYKNLYEIEKSLDLNKKDSEIDNKIKFIISQQRFINDVSSQFIDIFDKYKISNDDKLKIIRTIMKLMNNKEWSHNKINKKLLSVIKK